MSPAGPEVRVYDDPDTLARAAADEFVRRAEDAIAAAGRFTVALSGGSTPLRLYRLLAEPPYRDRVAWDAVHVFWGDERAVPPDHRDSNYGAAHAALLSRVAIPPANVHRIRGEAADPEAAAAEYEEELRRCFQIAPGGLPRFDLVLLGMGADGHTASLFPGSAAAREEDRLVVAAWVEKLGAYRVTLTTPVLNNAACVLFLVAGAEKAEVLGRVLQGGPAAAAYPAGRIRPRAGELIWLVDRAAAGSLGPERGTRPA
jgi:6-phosphogluconolactonase